MKNIYTNLLLTLQRINHGETFCCGFKLYSFSFQWKQSNLSGKFSVHKFYSNKTHANALKILSVLLNNNSKEKIDEKTFECKYKIWISRNFCCASKKASIQFSNWRIKTEQKPFEIHSSKKLNICCLNNIAAQSLHYHDGPKSTKIECKPFFLLILGWRWFQCILMECMVALCLCTLICILIIWNVQIHGHMLILHVHHYISFCKNFLSRYKFLNYGTHTHGTVISMIIPKNDSIKWYHINILHLMNYHFSISFIISKRILRLAVTVQIVITNNANTLNCYLNMFHKLKFEWNWLWWIYPKQNKSFYSIFMIFIMQWIRLLNNAR